MPDLAYIARGVIHEDSTVTILARLMVDSSNTLVPAVQSDFATIAYVVYSNGAVVTASTSLTIAGVIYNSLQGVNGKTSGTSIWSVDDTGFNFKAIIAATSFPLGSTNYRIEVKFTLANGNTFFGVFDVVTHDLQSQ